jgi:hypothetical protein
MNDGECHVGTFGSLLARLVVGLVLFVISLSLPSAAAAAPLFTQCPAIGADTGCAILITINADGSATVATDGSQGPFDGNDDTLVGVQNNTTLSSIPSVQLSSTSSNPIFAFGRRRALYLPWSACFLVFYSF